MNLYKGVDCKHSEKSRLNDVIKLCGDKLHSLNIKQGFTFHANLQSFSDKNYLAQNNCMLNKLRYSSSLCGRFTLE